MNTIVTCWYSRGSHSEELYREFLEPRLDEARRDGGVTAYAVQGAPEADTLKCYRAKARHLHSLALTTWEPILYVDTDVLFLRTVKEVCDRLAICTDGKSITFQDDGIGGLCAGFTYVAKPRDLVAQSLLRKAHEDDRFYRRGQIGDQSAINAETQGNSAAFRLPTEAYWNCGSDPELHGEARLGWRPTSLPRFAVVVHAACVYRDDKAEVLRTYRRLYDEHS